MGESIISLRIRLLVLGKCSWSQSPQGKRARQDHKLGVPLGGLNPPTCPCRRLISSFSFLWVSKFPHISSLRTGSIFLLSSRAKATSAAFSICLRIAFKIGRSNQGCNQRDDLACKGKAALPVACERMSFDCRHTAFSDCHPSDGFHPESIEGSERVLGVNLLSLSL